jgi:hypothetical protein
VKFNFLMAIFLVVYSFVSYAAQRQVAITPGHVRALVSDADWGVIRAGVRYSEDYVTELRSVNRDLSYNIRVQSHKKSDQEEPVIVHLSYTGEGAFGAGVVPYLEEQFPEQRQQDFIRRKIAPLGFSEERRAVQMDGDDVDTLYSMYEPFGTHLRSRVNFEYPWNRGFVAWIKSHKLSSCLILAFIIGGSVYGPRTWRAARKLFI